jgi:deoxyribonuclease V
VNESRNPPTQIQAAYNGGMRKTADSKIDWPEDVASARAIQEALRSQVERGNRLEQVNTVAGVDVGFEDRGRTTRAAVAVLSFPGLEPVAQAISRRPTCFPYIPGYLSFRELPAVLDALERLAGSPDLILCDGQGLAHPRRFGLACHLGVLTDIPCIGVAKSRLLGSHAGLAPDKGRWVPLRDKGETIGAVLRPRTGVSPVYVSIGHRVDLETAIDYTLRCTTRYRLPETTRHAHRLASA